MLKLAVHRVKEHQLVLVGILQVLQSLLRICRVADLDGLRHRVSNEVDHDSPSRDVRYLTGFAWWSRPWTVTRRPGSTVWAISPRRAASSGELPAPGKCLSQPGKVQMPPDREICAFTSLTATLRVIRPPPFLSRLID